jgi:hypothetical protein
MKLKYYLRGMGIGIILTAIVMGFALGGRKTTISDAEVIERARALGMIDGKGVLDPGTDSSEVSLDDSLTSGSALSQEGAEISQEIDQEFSSSGESVSDLDIEEEETEGENAESADASEQNSKSLSGAEESTASGSAEKPKEEDTAVAEELKAESKTENKTDNKTETAAAATSTTEQTTPVQAIGTKTTAPHTVTIPNGLGSEGVARVLYNAGVIDDAVTFNNYLVERKMDRGIRAGVKNFPAGSSYEDIARIICQG